MITKSHNNYCSVGVMELCLLNLLILIDCFLCNSYPCVLFESLSHVINQESHVYLWNVGKIYLVHFLKFWNRKFIPNFPLKHVITSTNKTVYEKCITGRNVSRNISLENSVVHSYISLTRKKSLAGAMTNFVQKKVSFLFV